MSRDDDPDAFLRKLEQEQYEKFHPRKDAPPKPPPPGQMPTPTVVDARSWHGLQRPERVFLDDRHWFRMGTISNFSGPGGIGKTLACLQAGVACASGTQWLGRDIRAGAAMFYSAEEPLDEIQTRVDEICEAEMLHLNRFPHPFEIIDTSWHPNAGLIEVTQTAKGLVMQLTPMFHWLKARVLKLKPQVLFIDNRAQVVVGDENNRNVAGFSMRMHGALAKETGTAVIMLSHPSMSGSKTGAAGSTQWFNAARSNVFMTRPGQEDNDSDLADLEGDDGRRVLRNNKANYGPINTEANVVFEMNRWKCTDTPMKATDSLTRASLYSKAERVFMQLMRWCAEQNIDLSDSDKSSSYAPRKFDKLPKDQREGLNITWFEKAMFTLLDQKKIEIVEGRRAGRPHKFLVVAKIQP